MKGIKFVFIAVFLLILIIPAATMNHDQNVKSEIDNRMLTENPFTRIEELENFAELGSELSAYVDDRIGLRQEAVAAYSTLNNSVFHIMEHPYYMKGRDGYIFIRKNNNVVFEEYHRLFAEMIVKIDRYCKARGVPFLFVFEPEKLSVMREYAPAGLNYDNSWVDTFLGILDQNDVRYVNNYDVLRQKYEEGISVFNYQYDAGHWNDIGAFYGVNAILDAMRKGGTDLELNREDEFTISNEHTVDLQQNGVRVEEDTPQYEPQKSPTVLTDAYRDKVKLDPDFHYFYYSKRSDKFSPKTLMFQGSYMNTRGYKFMANALSEYIAVHDYRNIFDFAYYYNLFQPEYVIFEVAEYTFLDLYFSYEKLQNFSL